MPRLPGHERHIGEVLRMTGGGAPTVLARLVRRFGAPPAIYALLALMATGFPLFEVLRTYPFVDDFPTYDRRDDWYAYRVYAESVLHSGWTMPAVSGAYNLPAGFLYVYFVAGVMSVLGRNSTMVYPVQSALLGLAVVVGCSSCCRSRWCSFSGQASGHPWAWRPSQASRSGRPSSPDRTCSCLAPLRPRSSSPTGFR
jgi:hypothetical protein